MKNKLNTDLLNRSCICLLFLLYVSVTMIYFIPLKISTKTALYLFIVLSISLLTSLLLIFMYMRLTQFTHKVENMIDEMIKGNTLPPLLEEETLFSRIYHQLYQLQDIVTSSNNKAMEDRNNLQLLISDISHQVKTPLTNLNLLLSSFQQYDLSIEEKNSFIKMMFGQLDKITSLLESMIKASRLENGIISIQPVLCSVSFTIKKAIEEIRSSLEKKEINLNFSFTENIFCFHDPKWTKEALYNILENAVKYTPSNGTISVQISTLHSYIQITISDTGIGIASKEYAKIFERFYRSPNVHNEAGVGLGLYLARSIITQQNGYITVASQLGKGTSFTILLPRNLLQNQEIY